LHSFFPPNVRGLLPPGVPGGCVSLFDNISVPFFDRCPSYLCLSFFESAPRKTLPGCFTEFFWPQFCPLGSNLVPITYHGALPQACSLSPTFFAVAGKASNGLSRLPFRERVPSFRRLAKMSPIFGFIMQNTSLPQRVRPRWCRALFRVKCGGVFRLDFLSFAGFLSSDGRITISMKGFHVVVTLTFVHGFFDRARDAILFPSFLTVSFLSPVKRMRLPPVLRFPFLFLDSGFSCPVSGTF